MIEIIAASIIHRIRGGGFIKLPQGRSDDIAALFFGLLCWYITQNPWAILVLGGAYRLAESFGWGQWVGVAVGGNLVPRKGVIDDLLRELEPEPDLWAGLGLTIRGLMFGGIMFVAMLPFDQVAAVKLFIICPFMPLAYFATRLLKKTPDERWAIGEYIYGAMIGLALW
jgi:hypothetical protein